MSAAFQELPEFRKPPVVEVAISVQFKELKTLSAPRLGVLWTEFRKEFPVAEQHPPLANVRESFDLAVAPKATVQITPKLPVPRCWFLNEEGTQLVQVQADRFALNWRKLETEAEYPRYGQIRTDFLNKFERFIEWVKREKLGSIEPDQSELSYVNHILRGEGWDTPSDLHKLVKFWQSQDKHGGYLPQPETAQLAIQYVMPFTEEKLGRLHINMEMGQRVDDGRRLVRLSLVGRGEPIGEGVAGAMALLDQAHEWIVQGFASITTSEMHQRWERVQ